MALLLDRRRWLAGALANGLVHASARATGKHRFFDGHDLPIGLQLYTLADMVRADLRGTLARIAQIGFRTVELAGFHGYEPDELRAALDAAGLACTSAHIPAQPGTGGFPSLSGDLARLARDAHKLGIRTLVMPMFLFPPDLPPRQPAEKTLDYIRRTGLTMSERDWHANAQFLNKVGDALRREGLRLAYHNHNPEFAPFSDGTTGFDILMKETDPALVEFELDAGWVAAAGLDLVGTIDRYGERITHMHVKDIRKGTIPNFNFHQKPTEVGNGMIKWRIVLGAAHRKGVQNYFIEQEPPFNTSRVLSVNRSFQYLRDI